MAKNANTTTKTEKGAAVLSNLPVDVIDVKAGFNPRGDDVGDVADLVEMIRRREMLNPITVCPGEDGRYYLIAGGRRLKAVQEIGNRVIACNVRTDITIDSPDALAIAMVENDAEGRRALPAMAQARAFARMMTMVPGASDTEKHKAVAKLMGRTSEGAYQNVRMTLRLLEVKGRVAELLDKGTVSKWTALAVTQAPAEIRDAVAARVTDGMTESDVKRIIRDMTHESQQPVGDGAAAGRPVDLEAEEDETDAPKGSAEKPASRLKPSTAAVNLAPSVRPLLMRNRSEIDEKIDELVQDLCDAVEDDEDGKANDIRNRISALLWASGAVKEIGTKERDFIATLNILIDKAENARGRVAPAGAKG